MRIQLIHPPIYMNPRAVQATRPSLPIGLAYIAAVLRREGHEVSVLDAVMEKPDQVTEDGRLCYFGLRPEEIVERIDPEARVVGISVLFSFTWPLARRIIQSIKERFPSKIIIGGGEHFTGLPEESLRQAPLDYLVLGEGETTVCELIRALESGTFNPESIPGLAFLREGEYVQTTTRPRIMEVDSLPWPAWDLFDPPAYYQHGHIMGINAGPTMPILATRGCPYACTFCSNPMMWKRRWCARTPQNVVDEIAHYQKQYGATNFPFHDLTAVLRKDWIVSFCQELLRRNLHITWQLPVGTRSEVIDREVTDLLHRTGCGSIALAPESGSMRTRKLIGKRMMNATLMRAVRAAVRSGLSVTNFFVVGFPHDTASDLWKSVVLAIRLGIAGAHDIALSIYFPIPGSELYKKLAAEGRISPTDDVLLAPIFSMDATLHEENNFCEHLSARTITRMKYLILLMFYLSQFLVRPWRMVQILRRTWRGAEFTRLDIFLIARKKRMLETRKGTSK
ncbi:MAG TPA: cobalamin-dependent protein [Candidatus Hydrogenedentes bacterium]|nr:cobalamin-dependent protein [Candidatus Hydrogenedentota bacterium]